MSRAEALRAFWKHGLAVPRPGLNLVELRAFEAHHGVALPPALAAVYAVADGTEDMDAEAVSWWSLEAVGPLTETVAHHCGTPNYSGITKALAASDYFAIGDVLIWSAVLAVRLRGTLATGDVIRVDGPSFVLLANSCEEFLDRYLANPADALYGTADEPRR